MKQLHYRSALDSPQRARARLDTSDFKRTLGRLIYDLRREQALSQERLALEAAVDRTWMGEFERGEANPTIDTLDKIARVLGQTLGSLMTQAQAISSGLVQYPANHWSSALKDIFRYVTRCHPSYGTLRS